jgi:hypothetical protein
MSVAAILSPVFVLLLLTFVLFGRMALSRVGSLKAGEVKMKQIALGNEAWPERPKQISNAFHNQLELPFLFYFLVGFALATRKADLLFVVMSWLFVAARYAHAYVHTTSNNVTLRFNLFGVGAFVLMAMWIIFAARILLAL